MAKFTMLWYAMARMNDSQTITIVSGLPRSGTSMMMKMLEAGGIPPLTDEERTADEDNPKGYYEFERVKQLPHDTDWLPDAEGKAVKMVFTLLHDLPSDYTYRIIFMRRKMEEILASQKKMLERRGKAKDVDDKEMEEAFMLLLNKTLKWLPEQNHMSVEYIWYNDMLEKPQEEIRKINTFLGGELDTQAMEAVVDESLYRNKSA